MKLVKFATTIGDVWLNPDHIVSVEEHKDDADLRIICGPSTTDCNISWHTAETMSSIVHRIMTGDDL